MRLNLTQASFRVLEYASRLRLQKGIAAISAAKLLWALFAEDECRAAHWLLDAGLSLEQFLTTFGIQTLRSPISAPAFPAGSYGISAGQYPPPPQNTAADIDAARTGNNSPSVGNPFPEPLPPEESERNLQDEARELPQDQWEPAEKPKYSLYSARPQDGTANHPSRLQFYLEDQWINVGLFASDLEDTLESVALRFVRQDNRKPISIAGGIKNIALGTAAMTLSTEHLLLAAVLDRGDVGRWLQENGFDPAELYQRIASVEDSKRQTEGSDGRRQTADGSRVGDFVAIESQSDDCGSATFASAAVSPSPLLRLLDAAANRGREAVRVIEDYVRFMRNDADLTQRLKTFRHQFQEVLHQFPILDRMEARDAECDVGTELTAEGEYVRPTLTDLVSANFSRLQESLRSLEEFSKLSEPPAAQKFEQLRYQSYTLQKKILRKDVDLTPRAPSAGPLADARLYAIIDGRADEAAFAQFAADIISGGVDIIQLRDKAADDRTLLNRSRILKQCIAESEHKVLFIMNDRPDLALLAGADGVHIGQDEIPAAVVRQIAGSLLVGVSTHTIEQARQAVRDGADYIGAGPVYESSTKAFAQFSGVSFLREVAAEITIPSFAIGGITAEHLDEVLQSGIARIAVSSVLLTAEHPQETAARLRKELEVRS